MSSSTITKHCYSRDELLSMISISNKAQLNDIRDYEFYIAVSQKPIIHIEKVNKMMIAMLISRVITAIQTQ